MDPGEQEPRICCLFTPWASPSQQCSSLVCKSRNRQPRQAPSLAGWSTKTRRRPCKGNHTGLPIWRSLSGHSPIDDHGVVVRADSAHSAISVPCMAADPLDRVNQRQSSWGHGDGYWGGGEREVPEPEMLGQDIQPSLGNSYSTDIVLCISLNTSYKDWPIFQLLRQIPLTQDYHLPHPPSAGQARCSRLLSSSSCARCLGSS